MKEKLVTRSDFKGLHPLLEGKLGDKIIDLGMKLAGLHHANAVYDRSKHLTGPAFCKDVLDKLGVTRVPRNVEVLEQLRGEPFITISNHPYGHIDGIALIEQVGGRMPNFKVMVNFILGLIDTMAENFITVDPTKGKEKSSTTTAGFRECIAHLRSGNPMGFFPSGAVSNLYFRKGKFIIEDRPWQEAILKIIRKAYLPVIPIHISGYNSIPFYLSRALGWQVRTMRLCHELHNKWGKEMVLSFGDPISPQQVKVFGKDTGRLEDYLRRTTYALGEM
ncbi:MAG: 1-acyl-sn-glycerol-3-phosphate acyltransferase [Fermentimonas sp.]|jgi:putative hemolysin